MHKIRGSALIAFKKYVYSELPQNEAVVFFENVRDLLPKQIMPSGLYNLEDSIEVERKFAQFTNRTLEDVVVNDTRFVLLTDLSTIYRAIIRLGGVERILGFSVYMAKNYYNYSQLKIRQNKPGYFKYEVTILEHLLDWCIYGYKGAYLGILEICGYRATKFDLLSVEHHAIKQGDVLLKYSTYCMELYYEK